MEGVESNSPLPRHCRGQGLNLGEVSWRSPFLTGDEVCQRRADHPEVLRTVQLPVVAVLFQICPGVSRPLVVWARLYRG